MRNTKKIIMTLTIACMIGTFTGCSQQTAAPANTVEETKQQESTQQEPETTVTEEKESSVESEKETITTADIAPGTNMSEAADLPLNTQTAGTVETGQTLWYSFTTGDTEGASYRVMIVNTTSDNDKSIIEGHVCDEYGDEVGGSSHFVYGDGTPETIDIGLAQKNMKVLIVDADPQSDVSAGFGYRDCDDSNETLTALMDAVMKDEDIPSDCYIRHQAEGIDIICSNIGLAGTEVQLVNAMSREYVLKQILYGIKDQYDAVIIDCMPSLGMITINALAASDEVLIPVEASYLPIKGLQQLLKTIGKVRKQINPKLQVGGILFTMVDAHTNDARNNMELLRNVYGSQIHIFDNYIPFSVRMKEAVREGQSIFSYDPKGKATEAYRRVTEEVLKDAI